MTTKPNEPTTVVLGAGASRSVSYANIGGHPSPLDSDFFDLLVRLEPSVDEDFEAVKAVLKQINALPQDYRRSMERAFYTLHIRSFIAEKLTQSTQNLTATRIVADFARCIQALLRKAHGMDCCLYHSSILELLHAGDTIISFNYDLVAERALREFAEARSVTFGPFLYGFKSGPPTADVPLILKLHGSSNWRIEKVGGKDELHVRTSSWKDFDTTPGYRAHKGEGFPILLPFWDKHIEDGPWLPIWQKAYKHLAATKCLVVWGYSLPQTDVKAQHLFSMALSDQTINLCVIDPSASTRDRWRAVLPKARYWEYGGIGDFIDQPPRWLPVKKKTARKSR